MTMSDPQELSMGRLIDRERIRGASRMIPEGTEASKVTDEQIQQVAADVESACRAYKISRKTLARTAGYSPGVISEFIAGKYAGSKGQVAIDLEHWLVEEEQRRSRPQTTQFVWTNVAMQIKATANYCLDFKKIGMIYGPDASGIGKTMALQAIHQEMGPRRSTLATIDKVDANPTGLLKKLCDSMHVDHTGSNRQKFERLVKALVGRSHLMMIDQIHNLRGAKEDKPFYILTDLYDATSTAQLWCGTADLVAYLQRQRARNADESLAQVCRRVFPRVDLMAGVRDGGTGEPIVSVENVREMFAKNKLKLTHAAARFLTMIANQPDSGSVGLCVQIVEYATAMGERLTAIDLPVLKEAMSRGLTTARADLLMHDMEEAPARLAKVG
jgi:DNA transposition AAA+ family ATPase